MDNPHFTCPNGHNFTFQEAWDCLSPACVHHIGDIKIADLTCPECGARVKEEIQ